MNPIRKIIKSTISSYLQDLRKNRGLSQEEMAEKLAISARAYSDLERNKSCISMETLVHLFLLLDSQEWIALWQRLRDAILSRSSSIV